jgi:hypothetical protein
VNDLIQHALVIALVALCAAFVLWQSIRTLRGRGGKVGSCCAKGCDPAKPGEAKPPAKRVAFIPVAKLARKR